MHYAVACLLALLFSAQPAMGQLYGNVGAYAGGYPLSHGNGAGMAGRVNNGLGYYNNGGGFYNSGMGYHDPAAGPFGVRASYRNNPRPPSGSGPHIDRVIDGDSFALIDESNTRVVVRIQGIDAPETDQPLGLRARDALAALVIKKRVVVGLTGKTDLYGRSLAWVTSGDIDVGLQLVKEGLAWHAVKYSNDARLAEAEYAARAVGLGLWRDPDAVPPWEWRAMEKAAKPSFR
jgi:micrococcal nuclease